MLLVQKYMKNEAQFKWQCFCQARIILYIVVFVNFVVVYKFNPFSSLCDDGTNHCLMCGMRGAVDKILELDFYGAYLSNQYIVVVLFASTIILSDIIYICIHLFKRRKED